ncbi:MAG: D-alanine--D-alanine ligase [Xanthomonadales bacterium]|nr:D-alanine--D-alanine ligase [Xanthomonadales bacterium]
MKPVVQTALVLHQEIADGTRLDELDTLVQVEQVSAALKELGWNVVPLAAGLDLAAILDSIRSINPACVFNLVESLGGEGRLIHFIPALLQAYGIPFTGCSGDAVYLSSHKLLAKALMSQRGIATPPDFSAASPTPTNSSLGQAAADAQGQWIVKSVWEHASFGLDDGCVVDSIAAAQKRIAESTRRHGGEWFAEEFIAGREFNISVLQQDGQPRILPMAEMTFVDYPADKPKIVGYAAKWEPEAPEFHATCREFPVLSGELFNALQQDVLACWEAFGLSGYARVDFRVDEAGKPWVLEVNANPCIAADAGFIAAAQRTGIAHEQVVEHIVQAALPKSRREQH